jgi:hypothetical protein
MRMEGKPLMEWSSCGAGAAAAGIWWVQRPPSQRARRAQAYTARPGAASPSPRRPPALPWRRPCEAPASGARAFGVCAVAPPAFVARAAAPPASAEQASGAQAFGERASGARACPLSGGQGGPASGAHAARACRGPACWACGGSPCAPRTKASGLCAARPGAFARVGVGCEREGVAALRSDADSGARRRTQRHT